jgi:hypothetical protein
LGVCADNGSEHIPSGEAASITHIASVFSSLMTAANNKGDPWLRNAHAKGHGCVRAYLNISSKLDPSLQQGIFQPGKSYPTFIRYSNGAGRGFAPLSTNKSDALPDNRGMAIKIFITNTSTQDFLYTTDRNGFLPDAKTAEGFFTAVSKGKLPLAAFLATHPAVAKNLGLLGVNGITSNLLKTTFWQQVPSRYGARAAKFRITPCAQNSKLPDGPSTLKNFLADNLHANLASGATACYSIAVQFFDSDKTTPIEDSTAQWNTQWFNIATLGIEAYAARYSFGPKQLAFCDYMSFNPWHTTVQHQPLGCLNRIRHTVYTNDASHRHVLQKQRDSEVTLNDWRAFPKL